MVNVYFISRHSPTPEQCELLAQHGRQIIACGDLDGFDMDAIQAWRRTHPGSIEVAVVNAALALSLAATAHEGGMRIWVFENAQRPIEGGKPQFYAKSVQSWTVRNDSAYGINKD